MKLSFVFLFCLFSLLSQTLSTNALTNITVDDTNDMITYKGIWEGDGSHTSSLDIGGSHTLSSDRSATATFTFWGVGVCYVSPEWPYNVNVMVTVDDGPRTILNLTDPAASTTNPGGSESSESIARWCMTALSNSLHKVVVSMPPDGSVVVVDGFIYTVDNGAETTTSSFATTTATGNSSVSSSGSRTNVLAIVLGAVLGAVLCVVVPLTALSYILKRQRYGSEVPGGSFMTNNDTAVDPYPFPMVSPTLPQMSLSSPVAGGNTWTPSPPLQQSQVREAPLPPYSANLYG